MMFHVSAIRFQYKRLEVDPVEQRSQQASMGIATKRSFMPAAMPEHLHMLCLLCLLCNVFHLEVQAAESAEPVDAVEIPKEWDL